MTAVVHEYAKVEDGRCAPSFHPSGQVRMVDVELHEPCPPTFSIKPAADNESKVRCVRGADTLRRVRHVSGLYVRNLKHDCAIRSILVEQRPATPLYVAHIIASNYKKVVSFLCGPRVAQAHVYVPV